MQRSARTTCIAIVFAAAATALFVSACGPSEEVPAAVDNIPASSAFKLMEAGDTVPAYGVQLLDGAVEHIGGEQPVTLLNLWATWCAPCRKEFPDLEALHRELKDDGLRIIAVDVDAEPAETLRNVAADLDLTLTIARDTAGTIQQAYPAVGVPTSFLLSPDGRLVKMWSGIIPADDYAAIRRYVKTAKTPQDS